ncbi:hypothetical protein GF345_01505 [Candidatus Woesearchaeota archaeon]|nr:hypothetical protein [Candidatus Woesearchaeota archaeon]
MRIPKKYGQSKINKCPFCGVQATFQNPQGLPVCRKHKEFSLDDLRCVCGESLEPCSGKFGPYFRCENCGNINFRKGLEFNEGRINRKKEPEIKTKEKKYDNPRKFEEIKSRASKDNDPKEVTVRSDELDFMYD